MKRLLILVLALTLCFAGCKEEPKMPDTPEVKHTEEVKAPIEETPEEPDGIEPTEEPDEPSKEPEEEPENSKTTVVLDFPYEPYSEPELVSPDEFEWGEYFPLITYTNGEIVKPGWVGLEKYLFIDGILSNETTTLQEAMGLYDLLESNMPESEKGNSISSLLEKATYSREVYNTLEFIDQNGTSIHSLLDAVLDNKYIIFEGINPENRFQALFSYNIETKESEVLATFVYNYSISPDGKYLAYSSPVGESADIADISHHFGSNVLSMKKGFYVKNLENGQTTFYSCDSYCSREIGIYDSEEFCIYHSMWWVTKENYTKLKQQE